MKQKPAAVVRHQRVANAAVDNIGSRFRRYRFFFHFRLTDNARHREIYSVPTPIRTSAIGVCRKNPTDGQ